MSVEIFGRAEFEKALGFAPLGIAFIGAETGQLEYKIPIASRLTCPRCLEKFYPHPRSNGKAQCPTCGHIAPISKRVVKPGEMYIKIYSSIDPITGQSRGAGEDSIRVVLMD